MCSFGDRCKGSSATMRWSRASSSAWAARTACAAISNQKRSEITASRAQSEIRSPSIAKYIKGPTKTWRFHLFADTGIEREHHPLRDTKPITDLDSVGIGTRVNLWGYLNASVQDAQTLKTGPDTKAGTNRVMFRLYGEF